MVFPVEFFKKAFLIGIGATATAVDRARELTDELVSKGEMNQKDARKFLEDVKKRSMKEKTHWEKWFKETAETYVALAADSLGLDRKRPAKKAPLKPSKSKAPAKKKAVPKKPAAKKPAATKATTKKVTTKKVAAKPKTAKPAAKKATAKKK